MFRKLKSSNISKKICILIMILLLACLMCIVYIKLNNIYKNNIYKKEGYQSSENRQFNNSDKQYVYGKTRYIADSLGGAVDSTVDFGMDQIEFVDEAVSSQLEDVLDAISEKKEIPPQWRDFYGDGEMEINNDVYTEVPDTTNIINDTCSTKGFLYSDYKDDFCNKYKNNPETINKMCKKMSITNCKIPSCCVLLDGKKCVAGNTSGPLFLTENGKDVDYIFYTNKNRCYGNCNVSADDLNECNKYKHNSIDISKKCMVQMFNRFGCSNPDPDYFINDKMVKDMSLSSKSYVENSIKEEVTKIVKDKYDLDNIIKCKGKPFVINKYREFNSLIPTTMKDDEVLSILKTKNEIDLSHIFLNYYR